MTHLMAEMPWTQYRRRIDAGAVVLLPLGSVEQHGPHLPLGTDHLLATAVSADAARTLAGRRREAVVAPALAYGYKSQPRMGGGQGFPGTTSLDAMTLIGQVRDILRELHRHGCRRVVVVNSHCENQAFAWEGIDLARREHPELHVMRLEYWDFTAPSTLDAVFPDGFPGWALEHAAVVETSLMLHYHPALVDMAALPDEPAAAFPVWDRSPVPDGVVPSQGVLSPARGADAAKGARIAADCVAGIVDAVLRDLP